MVAEVGMLHFEGVEGSVHRMEFEGVGYTADDDHRLVELEGLAELEEHEDRNNQKVHLQLHDLYLDELIQEVVFGHPLL